MCSEDPTLHMSKQQLTSRFAKWRCATISSIIIKSITIVFLIISLAWQTLMYGETEAAYGTPVSPGRQQATTPKPTLPTDDNNQDQVQVHRTATFGYFRGEVCIIGHACQDAPLKDLTCDNESSLQSALAFTFIGLFACIAALLVNIFELMKLREPLQHLTVTLLAASSISLMISTICLVVIRQVAHYDPTTCPGTIPGLVRYESSEAWKTLSISVIIDVTMLIAYALRRYANMTCCCPAPKPEDMIPEDIPGANPPAGYGGGAGDEEMIDEPPPPAMNYNQRPSRRQNGGGSGDNTTNGAPAYGQNGYGGQTVHAGQPQPGSSSGSPVNAAQTSTPRGPQAQTAIARHEDEKDVWEAQPTTYRH